MKKIKIVIIGGGFGGLYTLKALQKCICLTKLDITLINKDNYFTFTPMIHEVATGGLDPSNVTDAIRDISHNEATFLQDEVIKIDTERNQVETKLTTVTYDYLIIATGATTNYFGSSTAKANSFPLKTLEDSRKIRNAVIEKFEEYELKADKKMKLNFVVVGGGPTGVEYVAELAEFIHESLLPKFSFIDKKCVNIHLMCGNSFLAQFSPRLIKKAKNYLKGMDIKIYEEFVKDVFSEKVVLANEEEIPADIVVWAAGVKANVPNFASNIKLSKSGRLEVNEFLQLEGHENIFALGDVAEGFPMLAYTATRQAPFVARNINNLINKNDLEKFTFKPIAKLISLGQKYGIAEIYGINMSGRYVWFIWRTVYLAKILSWTKKIKIALNWTFNLFVERDISKI